MQGLRGGYLGSDPDLESPSVSRVGFLDTRPQEDSDVFTGHFLWRHRGPGSRPHLFTLTTSGGAHVTPLTGRLRPGKTT